MARIRFDGSRGPRSPEDLLAQARRRGMQIRQRRQVFAAGGAAMTVGLAAIVAAVAWPGPSHRVVQVVSPTTAATTPAPTTATSARTTTTTATTPPPRPKSTTSVPSAPSSTVATAVVASPTTSTPPPPVVKTVTDANNGTTVSIPAGSTLIVKLAADNWTIGPASDKAVLAMQESPRQIRTKCIPGGTCGTTTASFRAGKPGSVRVTAGRTYCGEVIRCTAATGSWSISVTVTS